MAAKKNTAKQQKAEGISDTKRWIYGFALLFFALFLTISVISFFFSWKDDQNITWSHIFGGGDPVLGEAENWGGKLGSVLARLLVADGFGLFGLCIPVVLIILSLRIMRFRPTLLRKSVRLTLILMILGSLTLGLLFKGRWEVFGTGLGGRHGIEISEWLVSILGTFGTGLLLLLSIILYAIYINRNTISLINRVGKGLVDNSKKVGEKVGEAVSSTAAELIGTHDKSHPAAKSDSVQKSTDHKAQPQRQQDEEDEDPFIVRNGSEDDPPLYPGELIDDNGFTIVDRSRVPSFEEKDTHEPVRKGKVEVDDAGFVITDLNAPTPPPDPVEDENGFVVQYANGDEQDTPSTQPIPNVQPEYRTTFTAPTPTPAPKSTDVQIPHSENAFVASVPESMQIEERSDLQLERLPEDQSLSDDQIESTLYDPTLELSTYQRPPIELLEDHSVEVSVSSEELVENRNRIKETLENFGIKTVNIKATVGPTVTLYEIVQAPGVRISKIKNLEDDIAQSLAALGIRIIAPIPGKGTIGIEVPNKDKKIVSMYSVIKSAKFQESTYDIPVVLGKTIQNETFVIDLAKMPHLLVAGATGQGKSVGLNAIITSLLYKKHPAELKLVLIDPKKVELTLYSKLERHFLAKMPGEEEAIITDTHKVVYTLNSLCTEMDERYNLLRAAEVRKITEYNDKFVHRRLNPNKGHRYLPYIVVIIDEFADLIMTAGREIETPIARLAQLARAVGIHLVIATQRPTTNIITGVIKANFPARIAFRVTSMVDSRTIIDQPGANQLIGRGDMLISTGNDLIRVQCAFVDTPEIERITEFIANQRGYTGAYELPEYTPENGDSSGASGSKSGDMSQLDSMFEEVAQFVVQNQVGSTSSIQRRFSIGYNRAGRIMDQLEMAGIVGKAEGSKPREVLIQDMMLLEHILSSLDR